MEKLYSLMNSEGYCNVLQRTLFLAAYRKASDNFILQQENIAIHAPNITKLWFDRFKVAILDFPATFTDLNIISNVWGQLARGCMLVGDSIITSQTSKLRCAMLGIDLSAHTQRRSKILSLTPSPTSSIRKSASSTIKCMVSVPI